MVGEDEQLVAVLRGAGLRVTSQRVVLHRALHELGRHATADELARAAADRLPRLSLPTVYASLDLFERLGLVRRVRGAGGAVLYDPRTDAHEHFVCRRCGSVVDVEAQVDPAGVLAAARRAGLDVEHVDVVLGGICADCR